MYQFHVRARRALATLLIATTALGLGGCNHRDRTPLPSFSQQPASASVTEGAAAQFSVAVTPSSATLQWRRNGQAIAGAVAASLSVPATTLADDGARFDVVATTAAGSATSSSATLTVRPAAPAITTQPAAQSVTEGATATFTTVATGSALTYQWQRGTTDIAGATGASYTTPATALGDDGASFRVIVTNAGGSVTSASATLSVTPFVPPANAIRATPMIEDSRTDGFALKADGTVWGWGFNGNGILGVGDVVARPSPVPVRSPDGLGVLDHIVRISVGTAHVLALRDDGTVWTWGTTTALGVGGTTQGITLPQQVLGPNGVGFLTDVVDVSAGEFISAAVLNDGTVVTWGRNTTGALGFGTFNGQGYDPAVGQFPAVVPGVTGAVQVSAGASRVFARTNDGRIWAWGDNGNGELGTGSTALTSATPTLVAGISSAVRVVAGNVTTLAILADGTARIWGTNGYNGSAGTGTNLCAFVPASSPVAIPLPGGTASTYTSIATITGTQLFVYGGQAWQTGALVEDAATDVCTRGLATIALPTGVVGVARSWGAYTHVWTADGSVYGYADNAFGQLGTGDVNTTAGARLLSINLLGAPVTGTGVFATDFESPLPAEIDAGGGATRTPVQNYAGLGASGHAFAGQFLRSATGNVVTVTLTNLPAHSSLNLAFLYAAIDSLDGAGSFPAGDFFRITLDGTTIFREAFSNATPTQVQTYLSPPGVELARRVDLGFGGPGSFYTDSAYDLGADPQFQRIPHTGSTATFTFQIEGAGIQPLDDESWAMDDLRISVNP